MARILVVDDKEMMRDSLAATLSRAGHELFTADAARAALLLLEQHPLDLIITDLKMPKMDGLAFIDEVRKLDGEIPIIMMTAFATIATAVEAIRKGAYDYIQKPFDADEITMLAGRALEHQRVVRENEAYRTQSRAEQRARPLIGQGAALRKVRERVRLVAQSSATVLIRGESGTGKELIAQALHQASPRANRPYLAVNCAALSSSLLESELFGHERGAFTGADKMRKGRFELADGGTLLLDEISEMNLPLQAKLLRVLQERSFERVGSSVTRKVDVRVIATTNRNLEEWVRQGKFREDLYYRLHVLPVELPPLRDRPEDIEELCDYFLRRCAEREGTAVRRLAPEAAGLLRRYDWPGNVRELENLMERVSILSMGAVVNAETVGAWLDPAQMREADAPLLNRTGTLAQVERELIKKTLEQYGGHRLKTARALGIGLRTLTLKLKRWHDEAIEKVMS